MSNASSSNAPKSVSAPAHATVQPHMRVTWGPTAAILVTVLSFVLSNAIASVLMIGVPELSGWGTEHFHSWLRTSVIAQFLFILLIEVLTLGIVWWFIRWRKGTLGMVGLGRGPRWGDLGQALLGFFVYFGAFLSIALLLQYALPIDINQKQDLGFSTYGHSTAALLLIFISLVVLPPITEEILFRGFLFSGLRRAGRVSTAVLASSIIFGALHLLGGLSGEGLLWIAGLDTFVLALVLCYVRITTGSLWASMLIHAAKNSVAFVSLFILHIS